MELALVELNVEHLTHRMPGHANFHLLHLLHRAATATVDAAADAGRASGWRALQSDGVSAANSAAF